ncbi:hypothetical protein M2R47_06290 [Moraxella sp. Tifton1]|uniref:Holliday junction resolvase-like protein n=1 Tax=Moraxella oculi TaxID=2940516 RepID=UPI00201155F1|nr:Holliday junction resolvase-like protein [Moraxella sp. Tifton1]MCL1623848.1 hypothetical protein [Moraxella sp. Tifton1]
MSQELIWLIGVVVLLIIAVLLINRKSNHEYVKHDDNEKYQKEIVNLKDEIIRLKDGFYSQKIQLLEDLQKEIQDKALKIANLEQQLIKQQADFQVNLDKEIKLAQKRSTNTQRNVIKGQISEQFVPFLAGFSYSPADCQFLGKPIDYLIFHNLHRCADGEVDIDDVEVVFLEVKTGNAKLNKRQEILKEVINRGKISFKTTQIQDSNDVPFVVISDNMQLNHKDTKTNLTRQGEKWTAQEEEMLIEYFDKGLDITELMQLHKRNRGGIVSRLKKLGKIEP